MANGKIRTQSSLGKNLVKKTKKDTKMGSLIVAKVKKVYYKEQTVELSTVTEGFSLGNNFSDSGKLSAPYPKEYIGLTPENNVYGNIPIITPGMVVLVGFLEGNVNNPIIISTYGTSELNRKLTRTPMVSGDARDTTQFKYNTAKFNLYPSLTMDYIDGEGEILKTWNGNTFLSITSDSFSQDAATDYMQGTEYKDLDTAKYADGTLIEPRVKRAPNMLFKHQGYTDIYGNEDNHNTMFSLESDGTYRHSVQNSDEQFRTYAELSSSGDYKVRMQEDSIIVGEGQDYLEFGINREDQSFFIFNPHHTFEFNDEGLYIDGVPLIDNIDKGIEDAFKRLNELSEYIDKINDILEGIGERDLRELIKDTNSAITLANNTADKLKTTNTDLANISTRLENTITKYDGITENIQNTYRDLSGGVDNLRADVRKAEQEINNLKINKVFTKLDFLELDETIKGYVKDAVNKPQDTSSNGWFNSYAEGNEVKIVYLPEDTNSIYVNTKYKGKWLGWEDLKQEIASGESKKVNYNAEYTRNSEVTDRNVIYSKNSPVFKHSGIEIKKERNEKLEIPTSVLTSEEGVVSLDVKVPSITKGNIISTGTNNGLSLVLMIDGKVQVQLGNSEITSKNTINKDKFNNIAIRWSVNSKTLTLYVNNEISNITFYDGDKVTIDDTIEIAKDTNMIIKNTILCDKSVKPSDLIGG